MKRVALHAVAAMAFLLLSAAPAAAQSFEAQVDCGGVVAPGGTVPVTVRLESQSLDDIPMLVTLQLDIPGVGSRTKEMKITLQANQDITRTFQLNLPPGAPSGDYQGSITAMSDSEIAFDTCSFKVQAAR